jgi:hypothetical protein
LSLPWNRSLATQLKLRLLGGSLELKGEGIKARKKQDAA